MRKDSSFIPSTGSGQALRHRAFTLVEMLIVIGIIVLLTAVAVPTFRTMTGGRSLEAAANNVNAVLGRARTEAIGQQRVCGVLFMRDPASERVKCVVVQDAGPAALLNYTPTPGAVFLDLTDPAESILLPVWVGLQLLDDDNRTPTTQANDRYIGPNEVLCRNAAALPFNTMLDVYSESDGNHTDTGIPARCIGAILFDSQGRVIARTYRLKLHTGAAMTSLQRLLRNDIGYEAPGTPPNVLAEGRIGPGLAGANPGEFTVASECRSSVGLALFDYDTFKSSPLVAGQRRIFTDEDSQYRSLATSIDEQTEENWLDQNALSYYANRYNGSLVRGE